MIGRQVAPGAHAALVFDGAGYHVAKDLAIPENITLVSLPPYAPELNPIETSGSICVATNSPSPYSKVTIFRARLVGWRDAIWSANRKQMLHKLVAITAWASLAFIAYATLSPIQARPKILSADLEHIVAFAVTGLLFCLAFPRQIVRVCFIVLGSVVLLEYLQTLTPDRHGTLVDASEKIVGGALGIFAARATLYLWHRKRSPPSKS